MIKKTQLIRKIVLLSFMMMWIQFSYALTKESRSSTVAVTNGIYVAGDIGFANMVDSERHVTYPLSHQLGNTGVIGGGYVGYDYGLKDKLRVSIEGFIDGSGINSRLLHTADNTTYKQTVNYNAGIRLLPEYVFTPYTLGHVIFGYTNANFNIKDNGAYGYIDTGFNKSGFQTGLGFTTAVKGSVLLRMDALYSIYGRQTNFGTALTPTDPPQKYMNRFALLGGEVSLIYKFCQLPLKVIKTSQSPRMI